MILFLFHSYRYKELRITRKKKTSSSALLWRHGCPFEREMRRDHHEEDAEDCENGVVGARRFVRSDDRVGKNGDHRARGDADEHEEDPSVGCVFHRVCMR